MNAENPVLLMVTPLVVPLVIALIKQLAPKLPKWLPPLLAPALGAAAQAVAALITNQSLPSAGDAALGAGAGAAGVGVREVVDQAKKAGASAVTLVWLGLAGLFSGCSTAEISYQGVTYKRSAFISTLTFGRLSVTTTNGTVVQIENFANDAVTGARVVAEGLGGVIAQGVQAAKKP